MRNQKERMAGTGESVQLVIPEGLRPSAIRQTGLIDQRIVDVVGLVDLAAVGRKLMAISAS